MDELTVGSLFSGIGGIELGLERAGGFRTAWFVENNPYSQAVLRKHWPNTPIYDDVTTVDFARLPRIDVLTGGFPCQDISNAGKRAGITGSRSSLWKDYLRAISVLRPRIVFAENVAALTQRGLDVVLCDLAAVGYDAEWYCVPAAAVGAPHRRDRIIILAYPNNGGCVHGQPDQQSNSGGGKAQYDVRKSSQVMAYADRGGFDEDSLSCERGDSCAKPVSYVDEGCRGSDVVDTDDRCDSACQVCARGDSSLDAGDVSFSEISGLERRGVVGRPSDAVKGCWGKDPAESGMDRVVDGVPHWMDRIKCLGNAVVPQWAQAVGAAIKESEEKK